MPEATTPPCSPCPSSDNAMVFSSIPFLFYFLPITLALYFLVPKFLKNLVLLIASLGFYAWGEPRFVVFMAIAIVQGYVLGLLIEKYREKKPLKNLFTALSCLISIGLLAYCKYADFFIENFNALTGLSVKLLGVALPIGISFYTFQILSYTVDVARGSVNAQKNPISLGAYVAMFPQLIAGPIVRYSDIEKQLSDRRCTLEGFSRGTVRFVIGLAKKILIANQLGELINVFKDSSDKSVLFVWLYAVAYAVHIYFDFSGYSDMAIGLGRMLGFDFPENFNYPFISKSATEFWRRWHMTLGSWFRDYVYIPMGGNRVSKPRWYFNILVVWMLTGFWHGADWVFIFWGLFFAVLLVCEKTWYLKKLEKMKVLPHIYKILFVLISFVIFDSSGLLNGFKTVGAMFGLGGLPLISTEAVYQLKSYAVILVLGLLGSTPIVKNAVLKACENKACAAAVNVMEPIAILGLLALCTGYLVDGSFNPFLYFRF